MIHLYISLSGLISFLIVQSFANSDHPTIHGKKADTTKTRQLKIGSEVPDIDISYLM